MENKATDIVQFLQAGYAGLWIKTAEPRRIAPVLYPLLEAHTFKDGSKINIKEWDCTSNPNLMEVLQGFTENEQLNTVLFLQNGHWFMENKQLLQYIQTNIPVWASQGKAVVCISPNENVPAEIQRDFTLMGLPLPDEKEIGEIINNMMGSVSLEDDSDKVIKAAKGLTRTELENIFALSITKHGVLKADVINDQWAQQISKSGFLSVIKPDLRFKDIVGYDQVKYFILDTMFHPKAKGVMLIGPSGTGKTSLIKAVIGETKGAKMGIVLRIGKLFSKYHGETDANVDFVIDLLTSIGDNVYLIIDEFEKQFAGSGSTDGGDSGVTRRANSRWLDFLQDRPAQIYVGATANSFEGIPGEYLRPGRWDTAPFFVDLPTTEVKLKIFKHYCKKFGIGFQTIPQTDRWSGAEIEACCNIADMRGITLLAATKYIKPQALLKKKEVDALSQWGKDACIPAEDIPDIDLNGVKKLKRRLDK